MAHRLLTASTLAWLLVAPTPVRAQTSDVPLSELLVGLYQDVTNTNALALAQVFGLPPSLVVDEFFSKQLGITVTMNEQIAAQIASFPLGSSAAGFTWTFLPTTATFERSSETFGPTFAERALTVGRNKFNFGVNYQRATFDQLEGQQLEGGDIRVYTGISPDLFVNPNLAPVFEDALDLSVTSNTIGLFANYGLTDRIDVGVAIPIIDVNMDAALTTRIGTVGTGIPASAQPFTESRSGSASGIGDIVARAKYNFLRRGGGGLAVGLDYRLPTGDELELLGLAGFQSKVYLAASAAMNRVSPHFNFGYTFSGESDAAESDDTFVFAPLDEVHYAGGIDVAVTPRLTVVGDVVGRTLRDSFRLEETPTEFGPQLLEFTATVGSMHQWLGAAGVKFNPWATTLISGNVLFPLNEQGLTDNLTWIVGVDLSF